MLLLDVLLGAFFFFFVCSSLEYDIFSEKESCLALDVVADAVSLMVDCFRIELMIGIDGVDEDVVLDV